MVRRIFELYLAGNGKLHIAYLLNEDRIPNSTRYKQLKGLGYHNGNLKNDYGLWNRTTVGRILKEPIYTCDIVQGRRKKVSYKSKYIADVPKEDWIIVPGTHEPIIDHETFERVRRMMDSRTRSSGTGEVHALAGKVKCMDCGSVMVKVSGTYKGVRRSYLRCKLYATDKRLCSNHAIRLDVLEDEVLKRHRAYIQQYYDRSAAPLLASDSWSAKKQDAMEREIATLTLEIERRSKAMRDLYLDKSKGLLDDEQFMSFNKGYLAEKAALEERLAVLEKELTRIDSDSHDQQDIQARIDHWLQFDTLSRELAADFIDSIEVGERNPETGRQPIKINWLF